MSNDYIVFLQKHEIDIGVMKDDLINFRQAMQNSNSYNWIDAMKKMFIKDSDIWNLFLLRCEPIDYN